MSVIFIDSWTVCMRSNIHYQHSLIDRLIYHSLAKEHPWAEHLYKPAKVGEGGDGCPSSVSAFNHERIPMHAYSS